MRNTGFMAAVAAAVVGGGLIGTFGDFGGLSGAGGLPNPMAPREPADPFGPRLEKLKFSIDATRDNEPPPARSAYGSEPPVERGYQPNGCAMPRVGDDARVVLVGVYSGDSLSTVALGSQDDETGVVEVVVEAGDQPLYVVLSAFSPTIWRFSGATERVQKAVMVASKGGGRRTSDVSSPAAGPQSAGRSAAAAAAAASRAADDARDAASTGLRRMNASTRAFAGVVGLDPARVTTAEDIRCFDYFSDPGSPKAVQAARVVRNAAGRTPDVVAGHYSLAAIRLPSGGGAKGPGRLAAPEGFETGMWREANRFSPGGISAVRPEAVASAVGAVAYEVLPNQAGLAQLLGSGHLRRSEGSLKIVQPLPRFPAGLGGAHATSFVLAKGIPMPPGDPGHSCVIDEATGRSAAGTNPCF
jgi:hypothetical protein